MMFDPPEPVVICSGFADCFAWSFGGVLTVLGWLAPWVLLGCVCGAVLGVVRYALRRWMASQ